MFYGFLFKVLVDSKRKTRFQSIAFHFVFCFFQLQSLLSTDSGGHRMDDNAPPAKRTRLHRTCKAKTSHVLSPSKPINRKHAKQQTHKINSASLKMMDINDHCLLEMMERMNLESLCTVAEVCVRLKKLAQRFFATEYRKMSLTQLADPSNGKCKMSKIRQLLYNFGHLIKSLTIDYKVLNRRKADKTSQEEVLVFAFVRKYCFATIDEVVIFYDHFNESDGAVPIIMKNIQKIVIFNFGSMMFLKNVPEEIESERCKSKMVFQRTKTTPKPNSLRKI